MNKAWWSGLVPLVLITAMGTYLPSDHSIHLSSEEAQCMGKQIWHNECAGKRIGLTTWNEGEEFASLGIGHFIWYPEGGEKKVFKETFPSLLAFFRQQGVDLPDWLREARGCPWKTREEFRQSLQSPPMEELRQLLVDHIDLQVQFMVERLQRALPSLLKNLTMSQQEHIAYQFHRLAHHSHGLFVLLDYINFKGEGLSTHERYNGQGWGLLQVLEKMSGTASGRTTIEEFIESAQAILAHRVDNAPPERKEQRWLKGWHNRLDSYLRFSLIESMSESRIGMEKSHGEGQKAAT